MLRNWKETQDFNEREKAALAWTEAITSHSREVETNLIYEEVRKHFDEHDLVILSMAVNVVDSWNRISLALQTEGAVPVIPES